MNPIIYIVSLFYHWFNTRRTSKSIAYEYAIMVTVAVFFINFISILKILKINISGLSLNENSRIENYLLVAPLALILCFILSLFAPRKKIKSVNYDLRDEAVDFTIMFIYTFGSFALFMFLV